MAQPKRRPPAKRAPSRAGGARNTRVNVNLGLGLGQEAAPAVGAHHLLLDSDCAGAQVDVPAPKREELAAT